MRDWLAHNGFNSEYLEVNGDHGGMIPLVLPDVFDFFDRNRNMTPQPTPAGSPGDTNEDGKVDIVDALLVAQHYVGLDPLNFNVAFADVNCSGDVNIIDALLIAQVYVGLITSLSC